MRETVGAAVPYQEAKARSTTEALALYPQLQQMVAESNDPVDMALRISIAGNMIDFGPREQIEHLADEIYQAIK